MHLRKDCGKGFEIMADYHVGCGAFYIYAGTLNNTKTMWRNKSEVTDECLSASAQYLIEHEKKLKFEIKGKKYELCVVEVEE